MLLRVRERLRRVLTSKWFPLVEWSDVEKAIDVIRRTGRCMLI